MSTLKIPFGQKNVDKLNQYQISGKFHPYTCPNDGDDKHISYEFKSQINSDVSYQSYIDNQKSKGIRYPEMQFNQTNLVATKNGWICPVCDYTQNWAHNH